MVTLQPGSLDHDDSAIGFGGALEEPQVPDEKEELPRVDVVLSDVVPAERAQIPVWLAIPPPPGNGYIEKAVAKEVVYGMERSVTAVTSPTHESDLAVAAERTILDIVETLKEARLEGRRRLLFVSMPCLSLGIPSVIAALILTFVTEKMGTGWHLLIFLATGGSILGMLGLLPENHRMIMVVLVLAPTLLMVWTLSWVEYTFDHIRRWHHGPCYIAAAVLGPCWLHKVVAITDTFLLLVLWLVASRALSNWRRGPKRQLNAIWTLFAHYCFAVALLQWLPLLIGSIFDKQLRGKLFPLSSSLVWCLFAGCFSSHPLPRMRCQSWLAARGRVGAAAGIAALMGQREPVEVLNMARNRLRYITLDKVTFEDMVGPIQGHGAESVKAALYALSRPCQLGTVDVFLSHSWHDDAELKWAKLQEWRKVFKAKNFREPRMWIDKFCIDQADVERDLCCLPVFLAGCHHVLVLLGETYLTRLWCVAEIFVFSQMGRSAADIELRTLIGRGNLEAVLASFDVQRASCTFESDQAWLRNVISSSYPNGLSDFNAFVQSFFEDRLQDPSPSLTLNFRRLRSPVVSPFHRLPATR